VAGIFLSFVANLPTSAMIVLVNLLFFSLSFLVRRYLNYRSKSKI